MKNRKSDQKSAHAPVNLVSQAATALRSGDWAGAERQLGKLQQKFPHDSDVLRMRALALQHLGRTEYALQQAQRATSLAPTSAEAWFNLGSICYLQGQHADSVAAFRRGLVLAPQTVRAQLELGAVLNACGEHGEAITILESVVSQGPREVEPYLHLGRAYHAAGQDDAALKTLLTALDHNPSRADVLYSLGNLYYGRADWTDAARSFEAAVRYEPVFAEAWFNLAQSYMRLERHDEAADCRRRAAAIRPDSEIFAFLSSDSSGDVSPKMPGELVTKLFDDYAQDFESHLRERLRYSTPELLFAAMAPHLEPQAALFEVLDLGCGTGLMASLLKPRARRLTGVDLSSRMLEVAAQKKLYDELVTADLETYLADCPTRFDLIVAADVFVYFGLLSAPLTAIASCLNDGGLCAFSVEALQDGSDFHLENTGRYAHRRDYVERCCREAGLIVLACQDAGLRLEHGEETRGYLFVTKRQS